jgi:hypothetical protein
MFNLKNLALGIGIIVVFGLLLWQGIEAFYPSPQWNDYCDELKSPLEINDRQQCENVGGKWNDDGFPRAVKSIDVNGEVVEVNGYCDRYYTCQKEYDSARESHSQAVFIISLIVAIIVFVIGYAFLTTEPVGSALIGSGVWAIFWGSAINWRNFSNIWRFILLLLAFVLLIWFTHRLNSKNKKGFLK